MNQEEHEKTQALRELEWLIHYFRDHSREDLAHEIYEQITKIRHRAQGSLAVGRSQVIAFQPRKSGGKDA